MNTNNQNRYDRASREHFKAHYIALKDMSFAESDALFPKMNLETVLSAEFEKQFLSFIQGYRITKNN